MQMHSKKRDIWSEPKQQVAFLFFFLKATQCHFNKAPVGMPDDRKKKKKKGMQYFLPTLQLPCQEINLLIWKQDMQFHKLLSFGFTDSQSLTLTGFNAQFFSSDVTPFTAIQNCSNQLESLKWLGKKKKNHTTGK